MAKRRISSHRLDDIPLEMREHVAENMKERIYATITLIAVITAMWQTAEHHSVFGAIAGIGGTVVALWLATYVSARVSYRAVYGRAMSMKELRRVIFTSSGLLGPAVVPILLLLLSSMGLISMKNALFAGMVALLFSMFAVSFMAGRRIYDRTSRVLMISLIETMVGVGVILLKLAVGE